MIFKMIFYYIVLRDALYKKMCTVSIGRINNNSLILLIEFALHFLVNEDMSVTGVSLMQLSLIN